MLNDKKIETSNISTLMANRLHALETRLTSLLNNITTPGLELVLPPRRDSLAMVELNVTQKMVQETVKDMDMESSKVRHYNKLTKRLCKYSTCK